MDADLGVFFDQIRGYNAFSNHVFVDSTASDEVPGHYNRWLSAGCHIATPNKKFGSGPLERYKQGRELCTKHGSYFLYEVEHDFAQTLIV